MPIYGNNRLGMANIAGGNLEKHTYELSDHLGNVRATIDDNYDGTSLLYFADYYPGGMIMPGREKVGESYRFGYQGQFAEKDGETGYNQFEARLYDSRINRWLTTDPAGQYWSPYLGMGNDWLNTYDEKGEIGEKLKARAYSFWGRLRGYKYYGYFQGESGDWYGWYGGNSTNFGHSKIGNFLNSRYNFRWNISRSSLYSYKTSVTQNLFTTPPSYTPFGEMLITSYQTKSEGEGIHHINFVDGKPEYSAEISAGIAELSIGNGGVGLSIGFGTNAKVSLDQNGITLDLSRKNGNIVHGTKYSWKPNDNFIKSMQNATDMLLGPKPNANQVLKTVTIP